MRILAIESSGRDVSIAALEGSEGEARLVREVVLPGSQRTAQALAPGMQDLLGEIGWSADAIQLVAVTVGPGSFTGLRIGVTTAKTLAYAVGAEVIGVNTLAVIARQAPQAAAPLWTITDAQRKELFAAKFASGERAIIAETKIVSEAEWIAELNPNDWVTGPAVARVRERLPIGVQLVDEPLWQPRASSVGLVAWAAFKAGRRDDLWKLLPQYYRQSAAEEVRSERLSPTMVKRKPGS